MGRLARQPVQTLGSWVEEWSAFTLFTLKPGTAALYRSLLRSRILPTFGDLPLAEIDGLMIRRWVADMHSDGLSPSRSRQALALFSQIFATAESCGATVGNPCSGVKLPRVRPYEALFLSPPDVECLAAAVPAQYRSLIHVLAYGGLRWGEASALRRKRIDLDGARLVVSESVTKVNGRLIWGETKAKRIRSVTIPPFLVDELRSQLETVHRLPDALVYKSPRGRTLEGDNFRRYIWAPSLRRAGLPPRLRIHDLRHTCAAILIGQGVHPKAIQHHLGHATIDITMDRYGHLLPDQVKDVGAQLQAAREGTASE